MGKKLQRNAATGALESVEEGTPGYVPEEAPVTTREMGTTQTRPAAEGAARVAAGAEPVSTGEASAAAFERDRRERAGRQGFAAFVQGVSDAVTFNLGQESDPWSGLVREENPGHYLGGAVAGAFLPGSPSAVMSAGKAAGGAAARALVGEVTGAGSRIVTRALEEAAAGVAFTGAQSFGQQVHDVTSRGADFDAQAVAHEITIGGLLAGAFGVAGGALEGLRGLRGANRAQVRTGATGLLDPKSPESLAVHERVREALDASDDAIADYSRRIGAGRVAAREFPDAIPAGALERGDAALKRAVKSGERLRAHNLEEALGGRNDKAYAALQRDLDAHQEALIAVESALEPTPEELGTRMYNRARENPVVPRPFNPEEFPAPAFPEDRGVDLEAMHGLDREMAAGPSPAREVTSGGKRVMRQAFEDPAAAYERIWGRPFETTEDVLMNGPLPADEGAGNFGGEVTPTSESKTGIGKRRGNVQEPVSGEISTGTRAGVPFAPAEGLAPAGPAGPGVLSPAPEVPAGRLIEPRAPEGNRLNEAYAQRPLELLPNGRFAPLGPADDAALFSRFRDRALEDSRIGRARKAESLDKFRAEQAAPAPEPAPEPRVTGGTHTVPAPGPTGKLKEFADSWWQVQRGAGGRVSALDRVAARMRSITEDVRAATGGRLDSAAATDFLREARLTPARSTLGEQLDHIVAARKIGDALADESRGVATPLRKAQRNRVLSWLGRRTGGRVGAGLVGGIAGHAVGGPVGFMLGAMAADRLMGVQGRVAGAAGRMAEKVGDTASKLLKGNAGARVAGALRSGKPVYDESGHEPDPAKRAQQVVQLAANPAALWKKIKDGRGDVALLHPELAAAIADDGVRRIKNLSLRAPVFVWNALGVPIPTSERQVRVFEEYEAATHDLDGLLNNAARGALTGVQADALREQWPAAQSLLTEHVMQDLDALRGATRDRLRAVQRATGLDLLGAASSPAAVAQRQLGWGPPKPLTSGPAAPVGALKAPPPTPASGSARAPGN